MNALSIVSLGRLYCDLNFSGIDRLPELGQEVFAESLSLHAGGGVFITASYLVALGCRVHAIGTMPSPPFQSIIEAEANNNGVSIEYCEVDKHSAPQLTVAMSMLGDRAFMTSRSGASLPRNIRESINALRHSSALRHMHIAELATLIEYPELLTLAKENSVTLSLDCGWDDVSFEHEDLRTLLSGVDIFLPNHSEMERLKQRGIDETVSPITVVKQGVDGSTAFSSQGSVQACAVPATVVDTIGAGDAFNAGFIVGWLEGLTLAQCLARGNACGAVAVSIRGGATGIPSLHDVSSAPGLG